MVQGGRDGLAVVAHIHQAGLQGRDGGGSGHADEEAQDHRQPADAEEEGERGEREGGRAHPDEDAAIDAAVGEPSTDVVAGHHAEAEEHEGDRHQGFGDTAHRGERGVQVGEEGEHAAETDQSHQQRQQHLTLLQGAEFGARIGGLHSGQVRDGDDQGEHGDQSENHDDGQCRPPTEGLPDPGGGGNTHDIGHRQAHHHLADRLGTLPRRRQMCGHQGGDAEVGAVRQTGEEAGGHQGLEGRRDHRQPVADGEGHHQGDQQGASRYACRPRRDDGRSHHHAERVRRDEMPGLRLADVQVAGDVREQAHRNELCGADAEAAQGQSDDDPPDRPGAGRRMAQSSEVH